MNESENITQTQTVDLLNRCWMTHDAMWFFHTLQAFGIDTANKLNKSAIKSLAPIEIGRVKKTFGFTQSMDDFKAFTKFFDTAARLIIPDFMGIRFDYPEKNKMTWQFAQDKCFASDGVKRLGVIDQYECGVLYRVECWLDELGIAHQFVPKAGKCHMHVDGNCAGEIQLFFPE